MDVPPISSCKRAFRVLLGAALNFVLGCQGDAPPPPDVASVVAAPEAGAPLSVMGTGAMTPLALRLAAGYLAAEGGQAVVEDSVGSGGGVRAAHEGAIDLGMISRPLDLRERRLGLVEVPVARSAVIVAAHPQVLTDGVASAELVRLVRGDTSLFADGRPAVVLLRDRDESANLALEAQVPLLREAREAAYAARRARVVFHDEAMLEALSATPGAIGVLDLAIVASSRSPVKVLALDGLKPTQETVRSGQWRAVRDLSFVYRQDRAGRVLPFLAYVRSPRGQKAIGDAFAVPLPLPPP